MCQRKDVGGAKFQMKTLAARFEQALRERKSSLRKKLFLSHGSGAYFFTVVCKLEPFKVGSVGSTTPSSTLFNDVLEAASTDVTTSQHR